MKVDTERSAVADIAVRCSQLAADLAEFDTKIATDEKHMQRVPRT